jgi:hypothetical protein
VHILLKAPARSLHLNPSSPRLDSNGEPSGCSSLEGVTGGLQSQNGKQYNQIRLSLLLITTLNELELAKGLEPPTL